MHQFLRVCSHPSIPLEVRSVYLERMLLEISQ